MPESLTLSACTTSRDNEDIDSAQAPVPHFVRSEHLAVEVMALREDLCQLRYATPVAPFFELQQAHRHPALLVRRVGDRRIVHLLYGTNTSLRPVP